MRRKLRIRSHILKKSWMENFILCVAIFPKEFSWPVEPFVPFHFFWSKPKSFFSANFLILLYCVSSYALQFYKILSRLFEFFRHELPSIMRLALEKFFSRTNWKKFAICNPTKGPLLTIYSENISWKFRHFLRNVCCLHQHGFRILKYYVTYSAKLKTPGLEATQLTQLIWLEHAKATCSLL